MTKDQLAIFKARLDEAEETERLAFAAMLTGEISPVQFEATTSARYVADAQYRYARQVAKCTTR